SHMSTTIAPTAPVSPTVTLTARQRACLEQIARRQTNAQRLVRRAKMLLAMETGANNCQLARQMHLNRGTVRAWRRRWGALNAKPDDPAAFADHVAAVCAVYQHAPAVNQQGGHVISTDEKTGIQALERAAPTLPMQAGLVERPEYEYIRHGTLCLIANFNVATGEVVAPTLGPSRTEEDFAAPIA